MPSNVIVFDSQYTSDQVKNIERAQQVLEEAIKTLKNASAHTGWKCPEREQINTSMGNITKKLGNLNQGIEQTAQALTKATQRFHDLETRADDQTNSLSGNLKQQNGFPAPTRGKNGTTNLPVTQVPANNNTFDIGKTLKGFARNAIKTACTGLGGLIGAVKNGVEGITSGFIADVKEGIIDKCVNIFQSSYNLRETLAEPPYDDTAREVINIVVNAVGLLGTVTGLQGEVEVFKDLGSLSNVSNKDKLLKLVTSKQEELSGKFSEILTDSDAAEEEIYFSASEGEGADEVLTKLITETVVPFGLDETLIQGVQGIGEGAKTGGEVGNTLGDMICNFLGL